jgi:RimJ/RimL family protein N-acetyltransferase
MVLSAKQDTMYYGEKVFLRALEMSDLDGILKYWNTYETRRFLGSAIPMSEQKEKGWLERVTKIDPFKDGEMVLAIIDKKYGDFLGTCGVMGISPGAHHAEFGIAIHNPDNLSKGYGTDATRVMLWIGFNVLGLHSIYLRAFTHNKRAIRAYEKAGFKMAGTLREHVFSEGKYHDHVIMDITAGEFFESYPPGTHIGQS